MNLRGGGFCINPPRDKSNAGGGVDRAVGYCIRWDGFHDTFARKSKRPKRCTSIFSGSLVATV